MPLDGKPTEPDPEPSSHAEFEAALKRGIQATKNGNPYLLDVALSRTGGGAESTWHEGFKLSKRA